QAAWIADEIAAGGHDRVAAARDRVGGARPGGGGAPAPAAHPRAGWNVAGGGAGARAGPGCRRVRAPAAGGRRRARACRQVSLARSRPAATRSWRGRWTTCCARSARWARRSGGLLTILLTRRLAGTRTAPGPAP